MPELKVGDVVRLKSGSIKMTVYETGKYTSGLLYAKVAWMNGQTGNTPTADCQFTIGNSEFAQDMLEIVK